MEPLKTNTRKQLNLIDKKSAWLK